MISHVILMFELGFPEKEKERNYNAIGKAIPTYVSVYTEMAII